MKKSYLIILIVIIVALIAGYFIFAKKVPSTAVEPIYYSGVNAANLIKITSPKPGDTIKTPLKITGEARGNWYFEASFPITLTDWDGRIIAEGHAEAQGEWMTEEFVPFEATLEFIKPECVGGLDYCKRGSLILHNDNASGLSENDKAAEMTIFYE